MLGISTYFKDLNHEYLELAAKYNIKYLFTSLQLKEDDFKNIKEDIAFLLKFCNQNDIQLVTDISQESLKLLGVEDFFALEKIGVKTIRLDYGFNDMEFVLKLSQRFNLIFNASIVTEEYIKQLQKYKIDFKKISVMHNYYPQLYTGLDKDVLIKKNQLFKKYGIKVQAFVVGDQKKRFPFYEGLPTLEKHRSIHPYVAAIELLKECFVDDVIIGDSEAKEETLAYIAAYLDHKEITLKIKSDLDSLFSKTYKKRIDSPSEIIRIEGTRKDHVIPCDNGRKTKGSVIQINDLYKRYSGEIQLLNKDFPFDVRCNYIGYIDPNFIELLNYLENTDEIRFVRV